MLSRFWRLAPGAAPCLLPHPVTHTGPAILCTGLPVAGAAIWHMRSHAQLSGRRCVYRASYTPGDQIPHTSQRVRMRSCCARSVNVERAFRTARKVLGRTREPDADADTPGSTSLGEAHNSNCFPMEADAQRGTAGHS